jgi:Domain of unknown function (DUF4440)
MTMRRVLRIVVAATVFVAVGIGSHFASARDERAELLKVRESVWRAWFVNDAKALEQLVPPDTIVISSGEEKWKDQADILRSAGQFQASGGKLLRLEFPRTEIQCFGDVAVTYSQYVYETEVGAKRSVTSGRVTEIFVLRNGKWTNPGWHTDSEK